MGWVKSLKKSLSNTWKDLTNPGWKQQEKANSLFEQNMANENAGQATLRELVNKLLYGENDNPGSMEDSGAWAKDYLAHLKSSPDTAFNAGMTSLNRGLTDQREAIAKSMANRGIGGSGIDLDAIAQTGANRARGISTLQGQRLDRQGANLAAGANFTSAMNADHLNMLMKSLGFNSDNSATTAYANYLSSQPQPESLFNKAAGKAMEYYMGKWFPG
ncbi:hypothetical protein MASR1M12_18820 [Erysipelotrichia bacterium]